MWNCHCILTKLEYFTMVNHFLLFQSQTVGALCAHSWTILAASLVDLKPQSETLNSNYDWADRRQSVLSELAIKTLNRLKIISITGRYQCTGHFSTKWTAVANNKIMTLLKNWNKEGDWVLLTAVRSRGTWSLEMESCRGGREMKEERGCCVTPTLNMGYWSSWGLIQLYTCS